MKENNFCLSPRGDDGGVPVARWRRWIGCAGLALICAGCAVGPGYYWQAVSGQADLFWRTHDVTAVEASSDTPQALRDRLMLAQRMRDFASQALGLPDNDSYRRYADLSRSYVVWNVFATPALSMQPQDWCLPVAGCVNYLGFFAEADARTEADELRTQGMDVYVAGVPAYSTLGWFDDPLLNTFINWPEPELARLIFHELSHQLIYAKNDTEFNESFAATVEEAGVRRWLALPGHEGQLAQFEQTQARRDDFSALVLQYRQRLTDLYAEDIGDVDKLPRKNDIITELGADYARLRDEKWGGYRGYDRWFAQDINNATLASIGLYRTLVPGFKALLAQEGDDLPRFYDRVRELAKLSPAARREALDGALRGSH